MGQVGGKKNPRLRLAAFQGGDGVVVELDPRHQDVRGERDELGPGGALQVLPLLEARLRLKNARAGGERITRRLNERVARNEIHLYSWYGSEKTACFLQTPSKNEQNQKTKIPKNMPRTVKKRLSCWDQDYIWTMAKAKGQKVDSLGRTDNFSAHAPTY